jgi:RHH-type rel operon transcriptional repressor/antitoxin RelB
MVSQAEQQDSTGAHEPLRFSLRLNPDVERRLDALARMTGRTKSFYARALIEAHLEDLEDRYIAEARLEKRRPALTSRQVRKELGL